MREKISVSKDWLSYENACELAWKIKTYWRNRGGDIDIHIRPMPTIDREHGMFAITSDMKGGLPQRWSRA
jgi:hypothetical protein